MKCSQCNLSLIDEELESHICKKAKGFHIKGDILWLSDGVTEYPLKLSKIKARNQPQGNRENNYRGGNSTLKR